MEIEIVVKGTVKEGKSTVAALLYSLLGDYGVEPALRGQSARDVRRIAEGDPEVMVKKARAVPQRADQVTIRERQLPRKG